MSTLSDRDRIAALEADLALARQDFAHSERKRLLLLNSSVDFAIIATDRSGTTTEWNVGARNVFGWTEAEMIGGPLDRIFTPEDLAAGRPRVEMREALDRGRASDERWHMRRDGSRFWASGELMLLRDEADHVIGFLKVVKDRTREHLERLRIEASLRDTRDFARLALESVGGIGVWTYEVATDEFFCSEAILEVYGLDTAKVELGIARSEFFAHVHPDDREALASTMSQGFEQSGDDELEYRIQHPDGSTRWVLSRGHTYQDEHGFPLRRTGVGIDMTRQRMLEDQLRQSQKMEAVGQLTGGLAHDFNNLLTGIAGNLELLGIRIAQGRLAGIERYLTAASGATRRASALTHRLLAFSRRQTLDPKPTDVDALTRGMEELIRRTIGPTIELEVNGADSLWTILVDPNQLENALLNLCINSRDAMPGGGRLTIETSNRRIGPRAAAEHELAAGHYVTLSVSDTGTGMAPEVMAHAFDPFFTTKPIGVGTGLGLSMIHGFAQQSNGQVQLDSEQGRGTTVTLYLPRHRGEAETEATQPAADRRALLASGETVLVVDDEPTVRALVVEVLEELDYGAIEASDGAAGLRILQSDVRIDLLVTDVGLPGGLNGRQMADAARVKRPHLKILFITGYAENAVVGNGHLDPGMHVMSKPFTIDALALRIKDLLRTPAAPDAAAP